ncbi:unnamed protein product [Adineta ricciae]|uniref:Presenilin n=1 Tax=Adineta ricciae TaxID=249248 RepID=A0A813MYU0_ADIRI|nr:unnamed protein product [Adineta ricciae]CAF1089181.1 unnamed protein product [Adineta ricciae]
MSTDSPLTKKTSLSSHSSQSPSSDPQESQTSLVDIDYWSRSFLALVYPVSFTVFISAGLSILLYDLYTESNVFEDAGLISSSKGPNAASISKITSESFLIALIIIGIIALATCLLVIFVYYDCLKCLYIYLFFTVICVFSLLNISILSMIIAQINSSIDWITIIFYVYNVLTIAILCMFWLAPNLMKQIVTIYQCIIMILYVLKIAPEWIAWALLPLLAVWDILAVLLPFGPLYLLINLFQKRQLQVPSMMVYTTGIWFRNQNMNPFDDDHSISSQNYLSSFNLVFISSNVLKYISKHTSLTLTTMNRNINASPDQQPRKKRRVRESMLGLGDFIFYSILLSKTVFTSQCNLFTIIIIYLCLIMGILLTTIILVILHRPLPALPISLFIGLIVFFHYNHIGYKFADRLRLPSGPIII